MIFFNLYGLILQVRGKAAPLRTNGRESLFCIIYVMFSLKEIQQVFRIVFLFVPHLLTNITAIVYD